MDITEIRISLTELNSDRLRAFCSITFDDMFVIRDIKIIDGPSGPFVAMPSRRIMAHCHQCKTKNHLKSKFCNECGKALSTHHSQGRNERLYADIAHPINAECREFVQKRILDEFELELKRAQEPGYQRLADDDEIHIAKNFKAKPPKPHQRPEDHSADQNSQQQRRREA